MRLARVSKPEEETSVVTTQRILLVSQDPAVVEAVRGANAARRLDVTACANSLQAYGLLRKAHFAALLVYLAKEIDERVLPALLAVANARGRCPTVVINGDLGHEAKAAHLQAGVAECISWPSERSGLNALLQRVLPQAAPAAQPAPPGIPILPEDDLLSGIPQNMTGFVEQLRRVAPQNTTVLLAGETGTGKTRLAKIMHQLSPRRLEPFLVVDCGSLSPSLIESELFGHARGAFTGAGRDRTGKLASAGAGTLLLDEVCSLPAELQGKLLRALDERAFEAVGSDRTQRVKARFIAATNKALDREVEDGRFRADLYYRLNVVSFSLPPLRDRRGAIVPLAAQFLREFVEQNRSGPLAFSRQALQSLEGYGWPGNIRELRNVVSRAAALCAGSAVGVADLPEAVQACAPSQEGWEEAAVPTPLAHSGDGGRGTLAAMTSATEIDLIRRALRKHDDNRLRAASELGISRVALYKKLRKYGMMTPRYGDDEPASL